MSEYTSVISRRPEPGAGDRLAVGQPGDPHSLAATALRQQVAVGRRLDTRRTGDSQHHTVSEHHIGAHDLGVTEQSHAGHTGRTPALVVDRVDGPCAAPGRPDANERNVDAEGGPERRDHPVVAASARPPSQTIWCSGTSPRVSLLTTPLAVTSTRRSSPSVSSVSTDSPLLSPSCADAGTPRARPVESGSSWTRTETARPSEVTAMTSAPVVVTGAGRDQVVPTNGRPCARRWWGHDRGCPTSTGSPHTVHRRPRSRHSSGAGCSWTTMLSGSMISARLGTPWASTSSSSSLSTRVRRRVSESSSL